MANTRAVHGVALIMFRTTLTFSAVCALCFTPTLPHLLSSTLPVIQIWTVDVDHLHLWNLNSLSYVVNVEFKLRFVRLAIHSQ